MERYTILREEGDIDQPQFYGNRLLCADNKNKIKVAMRRIPIKKSLEVIDANDLMERRVNKYIKKFGGHPNLVTLLDHFEENGYDHLVLEYCSKGSLFDVLKDTEDKRFSYCASMEYFSQIADGVLHLRKLGYAHCDISLETIQVTSNNYCKLSDFGLAAEAGVKTHEPVGKYFYMAPEMYEARGFDPSQSDVWSLGILLFIMLTGIAPFRQARVIDDEFEYFKEHGLGSLCEKLRVNHLIPDDSFRLLDAMLKIHPNSRLTIKEIVTHGSCVAQGLDTVVSRRKQSFFQKVLDPLKAPFQRSKHRDTM